MNPVGWLSNLLKWAGLKEYVQRAELSAHVAWGLAFGFAGFYWHWGWWIGWGAFVLWDEFYCDHHWKVFIGADPEWRDLLWDLGSKYVGEIGFIIAKLGG